VDGVGVGDRVDGVGVGDRVDGCGVGDEQRSSSLLRFKYYYS